MHLTKALIAEFIGTFALVFIGAGAVISLAPGNFAAIALAHGFVIMVFAYSFGRESNSFLNPALTVGILIAGEGRLSAAIPIFCAQFAGGILGGVTLALIYGPDAAGNLGTTTIDTDITTIWGGMTLEGIGTFILMTAVLNTGIRGSAGDLAPFAIGMTVAVCIMSFGAVTGASVNPARTFGPAVGSGDYTQVLHYFFAQFLGAAVAAVFYRVIYAKKLGDENTDAAGTSTAAF